MGADVEVLVVGASLAGLCAARAAAAAGAGTLLVDAAPRVGDRPNPATVLMEPLWRRTGLPLPEGTVEREYSGLRLAGPSGSGPLFRFRAVYLDRRAFDRAFAGRARESGARISGGVRVEGALPSGGVLTEDGPLRARVTIFADGARSAVRAHMPTMRDPDQVAYGLDQLIEAPGLGDREYFEVRLGSFAPGWRAQLNPLGGDRARLWTFARDVSWKELEGCARRARETIAGAGSGVRVLEERRGFDPAFVVPGRIAGDGVLACGAAAGQGGLEYGARAGLLAGEVAARAVKSKDVSRRALRAYEAAWRRETSVELKALVWGIGALRRLSDGDLDGVFGGLSGVELGEREFAALLRGDPRGALGKVGAVRAGKLLARFSRAWVRARARPAGSRR